MSTTGNYTATIKYDVPSTSGTGGTTTDDFNYTYNPMWQPGSGANQFNLAESATGTMTASSQNFTLSAMPGPNGSTVVFAKVVEFVLINLALSTTSGNTITLVQGATHPWSIAFGPGPITIPAGGKISLVGPDATGWPVGVGATDQFTISTSGTATYLLQIKGA